MAKKQMKIRAWTSGSTANVKAIIFHPMETGLRKDKASGKVIPAQYIKEVECTHNGKSVLTCLWGPGVSKNPFLSFNFKNAKAGDTLEIKWVDNLGDTDTAQAKIG
ncbi:MAG: thiosulfate oxidation carrier complex protein SoxZ [Gammaproteobacteria bacterium]